MKLFKITLLSSCLFIGVAGGNLLTPNNVAAVSSCPNSACADDGSCNSVATETACAWELDNCTGTVQCSEDK